VAGLGATRDVTLAQARDKVERMRIAVRDGADPGAEEKAVRAERRATVATVAAKAVPTFDECTRQYIRSHEASWKNDKHRAQWSSTLSASRYVKLAEALDDRASFRRFCGFSSPEPTPERTAFVRFRKALVQRGLDKVLVDATIIASASEEDGEGRWVKHKGKAAVHGFKAHVGADADTALVEEVAITPANVNDGKAGAEALPDDPGEVFADGAYRGNHFGYAVRTKGGVPRIAATGMWGRDEAETLRRLDAWYKPIHRVRGRIEKIFGTWKRSSGLRRMRWRGLAKAAVQVRLTAIAYNLKRTVSIVAAAAA
jgi:IS5 family transposase